MRFPMEFYGVFYLGCLCGVMLSIVVQNGGPR